MSAGMSIRHVASIAGVVEEKNGEKPLRIANALVRIIVHQAPPEFQSMVSAMLDAVYAGSFFVERRNFDAQLDKGQMPDALRQQFQAHGRPLSPAKADLSVTPIEIGSTWQVLDAGRASMIWRVTADRLTVTFNPRSPGTASRRPHQRIDQARSAADGIFFFVNLPPGDYILRTSVPELGSRYGTVETDPAHPVQVQPPPDSGQPAQVAQVVVALPTTRVRGKVTAAPAGDPLPGAAVRLLGDTTIVKTGEDGSYDLSHQIAGKPTLRVTATRFRPLTRHVELAAGQERVEDFTLQPE